MFSNSFIQVFWVIFLCQSYRCPFAELDQVMTNFWFYLTISVSYILWTELFHNISETFSVEGRTLAEEYLRHMPWFWAFRVGLNKNNFAADFCVCLLEHSIGLHAGFDLKKADAASSSEIYCQRWRIPHAWFASNTDACICGLQSFIVDTQLWNINIF